MSFRAVIPDFQIANRLYASATVSFYLADVAGLSTGVLATLYRSPTGGQTVSNPQILDSFGKFSSPVYADAPVIAEVVSGSVGTHTTGVIYPRALWRGNWATATRYFSGDFVQDPATQNIYAATNDYVSAANIAADITAENLEAVLDFDNLDLGAFTATASAAAAAAEAARDLAEAWAEEVEDTPVTGAQFSALHHAAKAGASATAAANSAAAAEAVAGVEIASEAEAIAATNNTKLMTPRRTLDTVIAHNPFGAAYLHVRDEKAAGTEGGTFSSGAWRTRNLNTVATNGISGASLASNQITLPAGTYHIEARAPANQVNDHKAKLRNITDASDAVVGSNAHGNTTAGSTTDSLVKGRFTIGSAKVFELQHRAVNSNSGNGFGRNAGFGVIEVYSEVQIWKLD